MKIVTKIGVRSQFIKAAVICRAISCMKEISLKNKSGFENKLYGCGDAGEKILNVIINY